MATATQANHPALADLARLGSEAYDRHVKPALTPADDGKFVTIDVRSGAYEIDESDYAAFARLQARVPDAEIWLARVGNPAAYAMRSPR